MKIVRILALCIFVFGSLNAARPQPLTGKKKAMPQVRRSEGNNGRAEARQARRNKRDFLRDVRQEKLEEVKLDVADAPAVVNDTSVFKGKTALHILTMREVDSGEQNRIAIVSFLLEKGANPNALDNAGKTPLWYAAYKGHKEMALNLLDKGADAKFADKNKITPLHLSASYSRPNDVEVAKALLSHGALINAKDEKGDTPLDTANESRGTSRKQMIELLVTNGGQRGADIK